MYKRNIEALLGVNQDLAIKLLNIKTNEKFEVFMDEHDPININLYDRVEDYIFYKTKPVDEITKQYNEVFAQYARYPFLFFYGISNGLLLKMLLNLEKTIFVFEPEIELLYVALNLFDFRDAIASGRLKLYHQADVTFNLLNDLCSDKEIKAFLKTYTLQVPSQYYFEYYMDDISTLNKMFIEQINYVVTSEGNDSMDSLLGLKHQVVNLKPMLGSYPIRNVVKRTNTKHAVIVSTGPSLAKQIPLLKQYKEHLTILSVDASMKILYEHGIVPDFVFTIERDEPTAKFYEGINKEFFKDTVFMITSIVHKKLLEHIEGLKICMPMRPFEYNAAFRLDKWGYVGIGMSAANMACEYVYSSGYKTLTLIGQDLAFGEDGSTHSEGAVFGEVEKHYLDQRKYTIPGYYGKEVQTSKVWLMFLNYFKRDIPYLKQEGIEVYNCTEGGAFIEGAEHIPFGEFLNTHVDKKIHKQPLRFKAVSAHKQQHLLCRSNKLIEAYLNRFRFIKQEIEATFLSLMQSIEKLEKLSKAKDLDKIDFDELAAVIGKIDRVKDIYENDSALKKFGNITNPYIINAELELARIMVRNTDKEIEKKEKMIDWVYAHKSWLFFLAGAIEAIMDTIHMAKEERLEVEKLTHIDVVVDAKVVDFIALEKKYSNIYDLKRLCLEYELQSSYNPESLEFYYVGSNIKQEAFVVTKYQKGFERFSFENSVWESVEASRIEQEKAKGSFAFFVTPENYQSLEFINLVRKVLMELPHVHIQAVCWNKNDEKVVDELFIDSFGQIEKIKPKDIYELINSNKAFLRDKELRSYSSRRFNQNVARFAPAIERVVTDHKKTDNEFYDEYNVFEKLNFKQELFSSLEVYEGESHVETLCPKKTLNMADIKQTCFEFMFQNGKDFNFFYTTKDGKKININLPKLSDEFVREASFRNSLEVNKVDSDRYKEKSLGILASDDMLEDKEFIQYINTITKEISIEKIVIFSFDKSDIDPFEQKAETTPLYHLRQLFNVEFMIFYANDFQRKTYNRYLKHTNLQTYTLIYDKKLKNRTLQQHEAMVDRKTFPLFTHPEYFGYTKEEIEESNFQLFKLFIKRYHKDNGVLFEYDNNTVYNFAYNQLLPFVAKNKQARKDINMYLKRTVMFPQEL